jgi:hypothetical protein
MSYFLLAPQLKCPVMTFFYPLAERLRRGHMENDASHPKKNKVCNRKIEVISKVVLQQLPHESAAAQLGVTTRQIRRLVKTYKAEGPLGLAHKGQARAPANRLPCELRKQVLDLVREKFLRREVPS